MATGMQTATPWLPRFKPRTEAALRLFCFPYAGGSTAIYRQWANSFPSAIEVCPVQLPGRGERLGEPFKTRLNSLVKELAAAISPYLDKPFAFFGHSMGAIIGFELARELRRAASLKPEHLFISARQAPQLPVDEPITYDLPETEFLQEVHRLNGTPKEVLEHSELMQMMIPLLRADFEVVETYTYTPGAPLECPVTVFGGLQDFEVKREQLEAWREQTSDAFSLRMLPGDHFFVHTAHLLIIRVIIQELSRRLSTGDPR
jgi:medium-chain acyl-[acyl-carrier-protein] hydrolase